MLLTTASQAGDYKFEVLLSICCVMGIFDGCFVTLVGPIAFDLCGPSGASQAIGSLLALFSLPMTVGPPVAGIIHDKVNNDDNTISLQCSYKLCSRSGATSLPSWVPGCLL